jgi:hypothetical protein
MKQKYEILMDTANKQLIIREHAELDKDLMSLLCEESFDQARIKSAIAAGKEALVAALRTHNLYPPGIYADKIADAVVELFAAKSSEPVELYFDDIQLLIKEQQAAERAEAVDEESEDIDELLEEDSYDEGFEDKEDIKNLNSSLKIEDDEFVDAEDDS